MKVEQDLYMIDDAFKARISILKNGGKKKQAKGVKWALNEYRAILNDVKELELAANEEATHTHVKISCPQYKPTASGLCEGMDKRNYAYPMCLNCSIYLYKVNADFSHKSVENVCPYYKVSEDGINCVGYSADLCFGCNKSFDTLGSEEQQDSKKETAEGL